jgi:hypothetical protein
VKDRALIVVWDKLAYSNSRESIGRPESGSQPKKTKEARKKEGSKPRSYNSKGNGGHFLRILALTMSRPSYGNHRK